MLFGVILDILLMDNSILLFSIIYYYNLLILSWLRFLLLWLGFIYIRVIGFIGAQKLVLVCNCGPNRYSSKYVYIIWHFLQRNCDVILPDGVIGRSWIDWNGIVVNFQPVWIIPYLPTALAEFLWSLSSFIVRRI